MTKSITTRGEPKDDIDYSQKVLRRQEFGTRLYRALRKKRWNQSDLARHSGLGRDSISQYVRGRSVPSPKNLAKLSAALGIAEEILFPNYDAQANSIEVPTFQIKSIDSDAANVWVRINMKVPLKRAIELGQIIGS